MAVSFLLTLCLLKRILLNSAWGGWRSPPPWGKRNARSWLKGCRQVAAKAFWSFSGAPHTAGLGHQVLSSGPAVKRFSLSGETWQQSQNLENPRGTLNCHLSQSDYLLFQAEGLSKAFWRLLGIFTLHAAWGETINIWKGIPGLSWGLCN